MYVLEGIATVDDVTAFVEDLAAIGDDHDCVVQAFDARLVAGYDHLATATRYAARAHRRDDAVARDPAVEILVYAAGRRQIRRALELGVDEGETPAAVVVADEFPADPVAASDAEADCIDAVADRLDDAAVVGSGPSDGPGEADGDRRRDLAATDPEHVREFFDVGDPEVGATDAALAALVRERVVMLSIDH